MSGNPQSSTSQPPMPSSMGSTGPPPNFTQSFPMQYRPLAPSQQSHQFTASFPQQFHGIPASNVGLTSGQSQTYFSQPTQIIPQRSGLAGEGPFTSQATQLSMHQSSGPTNLGPLQPQQNTQGSNHVSNITGTLMPPSSYNFSATPYSQMHNSTNLSLYQQVPQVNSSATFGGGQPWPTSGSLSSQQELGGQSNTVELPLSDWQEHAAADGKRYYYNKKTRQSSWEKPYELMTPVERADASTVWKEFTTPEGRKYYYNKVTKQSKWTIPDELKVAREQAEKLGTQTGSDQTGASSLAPADTAFAKNESYFSSTPVNESIMPLPTVISSPVPMRDEKETDLDESTTVSLTAANTSTVAPSIVTELKETNMSDSLKISLPNGSNSTDGASSQDLEEARQSIAVAGEINTTPLQEKIPEDEFVYATKQEAKNAFKALLESANVESDWSWDQTMKIIVNDKRYGALKALGEKKQALNEYSGQRKKQELEEKRAKQKRAKEDFVRMLKESTELTSNTRWSKALTIFEGDERFNAVERAKDREDLFESYIVELQKKEKSRTLEEHKRSTMEYRDFLKSCDFIKVTSQWRKIQDRLEDDDRCSKLDKIERLEIFQEHMQDLERSEEEQKKIQKEQLRRVERKNRDEFRKMLEYDVAAGTLTAKTRWCDYCTKIKNSHPYHAITSNLSGSTPKDLFDDSIDELEAQYHVDKDLIKNALLIKNITLSVSWALEDFNSAIADDSLKEVSGFNVKLIFDELLERQKDKEEKEAKWRNRLADNFSHLLYSIKEITVFSKWDECKPLFEEAEEYRSIDDEFLRKDIFQEHIGYLQYKEKERENKKEEKEKERDVKEKKERGKVKEKYRKEETEAENGDDKRREKRDGDNRKHRRHHHSTAAADDESSDKDEKDEYNKRTHRHHGNSRKTRKHAHAPASDSDNEIQHKRHKKDVGGGFHDGLDDDGEEGEIF